jgi:uncharacterized membrane protein
MKTLNSLNTMPEQTQPIDLLNYFNIFSMLVFLLGLPLFIKFFPPKEINGFYGYRTTFSTKNHDTWREANTYFPQMMLKFVIPTAIIILSLVFCLPIKAVVFFAAFLILIPIFTAIFLTSKHLDKIFDSNGKRKI